MDRAKRSESIPAAIGFRWRRVSGTLHETLRKSGQVFEEANWWSFNETKRSEGSVRWTKLLRFRNSSGFTAVYAVCWKIKLTRTSKLFRPIPPRVKDFARCFAATFFFFFYMYVESKINPFSFFHFFFFFWYFLFPSSSENCFYLKKSPERNRRNNTLSVTVRYEWQIRKLLRITINWNYQNPFYPINGAQPNDKRQYLFSRSSFRRSFEQNQVFLRSVVGCLAASSYRSRAGPTANQIYVHNVTDTKWTGAARSNISSPSFQTRSYRFPLRCVQYEFRFDFRWWGGILFIRGGRIRIDRDTQQQKRRGRAFVNE